MIDLPRDEPLQAANRPPGGTGTGWWVPTALVVLCSLPLMAGALRLLELAGGPSVLSADPRIDVLTAPAVVHPIAAAVHAPLGAAHIAAGTQVALSGLWMTVVCADVPGGDLLWAVRLVPAGRRATSSSCSGAPT